TATLQHHPASSLATATVTTVERNPRLPARRAQRWCRGNHGLLGAGPYLGWAAGASTLQLTACTDRLSVVPGRLDKQLARVGVAGFGDRATGVAGTRLRLGWYQAEVGADRGTAQPVPVTD